MEVPKDQISTLLDHGLHSSAQMLVSFRSLSPLEFTHSTHEQPNSRSTNSGLEIGFNLFCDISYLVQGCFLVSSPAANAESSPHLKSESLVCSF